MRVFLSYRRSDVGGYAGRLTDTLVARLGTRNVFHDVSAIEPGDDFTVAIDRALDEADAVLAVIGPAWLTAAGPAGAPRLSEPEDYVRRELSRALERNVPVVPVLVGGAALPTADALPDGLQPLAHRQAVVLHDETWHPDVDGLIRSLEGHPAEGSAMTTRSRRLVVAGGSAALLLMVAIVAVVWLGRDKGDDGSDGTTPACPSTDGSGWQAVAADPGATGRLETDEGALTFSVRAATWRVTRPGAWQVVLTTTMDNGTANGRYHTLGYYQALVAGRRAVPATCFSSDDEVVPPATVGDATLGFDVACQPAGRMDLILDASEATPSTRFTFTTDTQDADC